MHLLVWVDKRIGIEKLETQYKDLFFFFFREFCHKRKEENGKWVKENVEVKEAFQD